MFHEKNMTKTACPKEESQKLEHTAQFDLLGHSTTLTIPILFIKLKSNFNSKGLFFVLLFVLNSHLYHS